MKNEPIITCVTAGWRVEGIKRVIKSVDKQTYSCWQHLIINDNNSELREWYRRRGHMYFNNPKRHWVDLGIRTHWFGAIARNIGAMMAFSYFNLRNRKFDNEWICFLDDDNLWYPDHLETLINGLRGKPNATLIGVDMEIRGKKNKNYRKIVPCQIVPNKCDLGSFLYNKKLFDYYGYFKPRPERTITFDYELIKAMAEGQGEMNIHLIHKPTFIYYHPDR